MILRLVERTDRIAHIPRILYHWRVHASSTAGGDAKPYAYVAARNAIAGHLERCGIDAEVGYGPPGLYRVAHRVDPQESIALVLAARDPLGLEEAARSWVSQPHPTWTVVLAAPAQTLTACADALRSAGLADSRLTMVATEADTDPAAALSAAADAASAELLLLMQAPAIGLTHDWLTRLIGYGHQPQIAAAGPIVLGPDGRICQAGIALPEGIPLHLLHGVRSSMDNFFGYGTSVYNVSAVSGMLATQHDNLQGTRRPRPAVRRPGTDRVLHASHRYASRAHRDRPRRAAACHGADTAINDLPRSGACARAGAERTPATPTTTPTTAPIAATSSPSGADR